MFLLLSLLVGTASADTLKVKVGEAAAKSVQLKPGVDWKAVRASAKPVQVGRVQIAGKQVDVLCHGAPVTCRGKTDTGDILKMESEFSDPCTCGPNGDGPCESLGEKPEDCLPAPEPETPPEPQTQTPAPGN